MRHSVLLVAGLVLVLLGPVRAFAQASASAAPPCPIAATAADAQVEPLFAAMCAALSAPKSFAFRCAVAREYAFPSGDSVRLDHEMTAQVARPDRFRVEIAGDDMNVVYAYDGKKLAFYDVLKNVYAQTPGKGTTEATLTHMLTSFSFGAPLAELLGDSPCAGVDLAKFAGRYLGQSRAGGRLCHHLAFFGRQHNLQLWIDATDYLPRRIVITDKAVPGWPTFTADFTAFRGLDAIAAKTFSFAPPKGAREIPFAPLPAPGGKTKE